MSTLLEQARRDLQFAQSAARKIAGEHRWAMAVNEAEQRVQRLEMAQIDTDILMHELQRRACGGRS